QTGHKQAGRSALFAHIPNQINENQVWLNAPNIQMTENDDLQKQCAYARPNSFNLCGVHCRASLYSSSSFFLDVSGVDFTMKPAPMLYKSTKGFRKIFCVSSPSNGIERVTVPIGSPAGYWLL